jgi:hypothetical protein
MVAVYYLTQRGGEVPRYVGSSLYPERRATAHFYNRRESGRFNAELAIWLDDVGIPDLHVIAWVPAADRYDAEADWTDAFRNAGHPLFNKYSGMRKPPGYGEKMSLILRARCMRRSAATRAKISAALTGRTVPEATRERIRQGRLAYLERQREVAA